MPERDYALEDSQLDDELRALYAQDSESEVNPEPENPDDTGTSPEVQTENPQSQEDPTETEGTLIDGSEQKNEEPVVKEEKNVFEERYNNARKEMSRAQQELLDYKKQSAARDQLIQQLQAQVQQLQDKQTTKEAESTPLEAEDDDDLKEALDLYPEAVAPLLKRNASLEKKLAALEKKLDEANDSIGNVKTVAERFKQTEQQTAEDNFWKTIRSKHDDVDNLINDPSYLDWYPNQSPMIQQALQLKGTAQDVVAALNLFRAEYPKAFVPEIETEHVATKPVANKPDKLAEARAASSPNIKSTAKPEKKPTYTNAQIAKMSREEYMKHEAAIDEALARGEIY